MNIENRKILSVSFISISRSLRNTFCEAYLFFQYNSQQYEICGHKCHLKIMFFIYLDIFFYQLHDAIKKKKKQFYGEKILSLKKSVKFLEKMTLKKNFLPVIGLLIGKKYFLYNHNLKRYLRSLTGLSCIRFKKCGSLCNLYSMQ